MGRRRKRTSLHRAACLHKVRMYPTSNSSERSSNQRKSKLNVRGRCLEQDSHESKAWSVRTLSSGLGSWRFVHRRGMDRANVRHSRQTWVRVNGAWVGSSSNSGSGRHRTNIRDMSSVGRGRVDISRMVCTSVDGRTSLWKRLKDGTGQLQKAAYQ